MEEALEVFLIVILFPILFPYFFTVDLLEEFGIKINMSWLSWNSIQDFTVQTLETTIDTAPALPRKVMDDIVSEKGATFAFISALFAIVIMQL